MCQQNERRRLSFGRPLLIPPIILRPDLNVVSGVCSHHAETIAERIAAKSDGWARAPLNFCSHFAPAFTVLPERLQNRQRESRYELASSVAHIGELRPSLGRFAPSRFHAVVVSAQVSAGASLPQGNGENSRGSVAATALPLYRRDSAKLH